MPEAFIKAPVFHKVQFKKTFCQWFYNPGIGLVVHFPVVYNQVVLVCRDGQFLPKFHIGT